MKEFKYTDDYPQWLKISELKPIHIKYLDDVTVVYRRTVKSAYIVKRAAVDADRLKNYEYALKDAKGFISRIVLKGFIKQVKRENSNTNAKNLIQFIHEFYWLKNRIGLEKMNIDKIESILKYVKYITKKS